MNSNVLQAGLKILLIALTSVSLLAPDLAYAGKRSRRGTTDRGGGNGSKSTREEILRHINGGLNFQLTTALERMEAEFRNMKKIGSEIKPTNSKEIIEKFNNGINFTWLTESMYDLVEDMDTLTLAKKIKFQPVDGNCYDPETSELRDSSITQEGLMCISTTRLQRYPKYAIKIELLALAMHELSHLKGYDEPDAEELQDDVLNNINRLTDPMIQLHPTSLSRKKSEKRGDKYYANFSKAEYQLSPGIPAKYHCEPKVGMKVIFATYLAFGMGEDIGWTDISGTITKVNSDKSIEVEHKIYTSPLISQGARLDCLDLE